MAASRRFPRPSLIAQLGAAPWKFGFFQAVRILEWRRARKEPSGRADTVPMVGDEANPGQRTLRFRSAMRLSYPASEIEAFSDEGGGELPAMTVTFMGLSGPSSVLPLHYGVAVWREFRNHNTALRDFFDLFSDRLIAFFYRAWAKYRVPISVERSSPAGQDGVSEALRSFIGFGTEHLSGRVHVDEHALLHYSGLLSHFPRNAASLEDMLCDYFRLPIEVVPFDGRWVLLPADQRTRLSGGDGGAGGFASLSVDAVVGESYWDVESSFTIDIGPVGYADFLSFLPNGANLRRLAALTKLYVSPEMGARVQLCLKRDEVPLLQLGAGGAPPQLGWNTWLHHERMIMDPRDASFRL
jgi:type VI secretion system protein ImpH